MNTTILMIGGHITPAVAVTQAIKRVASSTRVILAGRTVTGPGVAAIEREEIERVGGIFLPFVSGKLHRFFTLRQFTETGKLVRGLRRAREIIQGEHPDVILSFGGYLAFPFVVLAKLYDIPLVIHEQTTSWGAVNALSRRWAKVVAVSWPLLNTPGTILTGNPMPEEIIRIRVTEKKEGEMPVLYVTGGNQGSLAIDRAIGPILPQLLERWVVYHQSQHPLHAEGARYKWSRWFPTPLHAQILAQTSVSVSRSGANTVFDLAYVGIPSVLVPLAIAAGHEQATNAAMLARTGLAQVISEKDLTPNTLLSSITHLYLTRHTLKKTAADRARSLVIPNAADRLAKLVLDLLPA